MTAEQLEASRAERMRLNGNGALTLEDARTWIEETGLCLFLPRRQFSAGVAPSFVEAIVGRRNVTPDAKQIALAEELLVRLEIEGVAVRLNLLGQPGEQPDFVVAAWVLPYVYALRGDRDWRRSPQLTGSRQVSPLAIQTYKLLEAGDATIPRLKHALGKEVTEAAVLRAITELWQQLRIIPVIAAPGQAAQWQLLRHRFQKAIAEGASTSQVTAISVLASIYLQAVIAASMEEVELFLAPLTARSKVREVLRGLVATRQVHTLSLGHAPHFYVAGTLPEFTTVPTSYASSAMAASSYFSYGREFEEEHPEPVVHRHVALPSPPPAPVQGAPAASHSPEPHAPRKLATNGKSSNGRPHFSRPAAHARDRKPAQASNRPARRPSREARPSNGLRHAASNSSRWANNGSGNGSANGKHNGSHPSNGSRNGSHANGTHRSANGNGHGPARPVRSSNGVSSSRSGKPSLTGRTQRNGKPSGKASVAGRKETRVDARSSRNGHKSNGRKPALTASAKAGNSKRYGFTAPSKRGTKKRG